MVEFVRTVAGEPAVISFNVTGSFAPADDGTNWLADLTADTNVALTLSGVADGAGRQSAKVDLGANMADSYTVYGCVDYTGEAPSATGISRYYWAPSTSGTTGNSNVAGNSGADAAAPGGALGSITLGEFIRMCDFIGVLQNHNGASVQNGVVSTHWVPPSRYGQLVIINDGGDVYEADDVEHHQVFVPNTPATFG